MSFILVQRHTDRFLNKLVRTQAGNLRIHGFNTPNSPRA
jgi:hypothetical protein